MLNIEIEPSWAALLSAEFSKPYFKNLVQFIDTEKLKYTILPPENEVFAAFNACPFNELKLVILGQDPYHGIGQANGLAFSVHDGVKIPPSLRNIYKELHDDVGKEIPKTGNLSHWAKQGVLMLNATLTVRASEAGSHQNRGWEQFTDVVMKIVSAQKSNLVFMLWGAYAQKKGKIIDRSKHLVLESAHPSPLAAYRGFFGNKHFSKANEYLTKHGYKAINW